MFLLVSVFGKAQTFNLDHDLLGKPYQPQVVILEIQGLENVPWLPASQFQGAFMNAMRNMPGMGRTVSEKSLRSLRLPYRKDPYIKRMMSGKHYLLNTYVDGGEVVHLNNGNEILKFISFQVSVINVATSEVEAVYRIECNSERFLQVAKDWKVKYPKTDVLVESMLRSVKEKLNKSLAPFFYNLEPAVEIILDEKSKKDRGIITKWKGAQNKDIVRNGYALALAREVPTSKGPVRTFISLGAVKLSLEKSTLGKPFYQFISGRGRAKKALDRGMDIFIYPKNTVE